MLTDDERAALDEAIRHLRSASASAFRRFRTDSTATATADKLKAQAETLVNLKKRLSEKG